MNDSIDSLHRALVNDLAGRGNLPTRVIAGAMSFYSPYKSEYVARVCAWQQLLCSGYSEDIANLPVGLLCPAICKQANGYLFLIGDALDVSCIHQIALLHWKYEVPMPPNFDGMKARLSRSGSPRDSALIEMMRSFLRRMGAAPTINELRGMTGSGSTADKVLPHDRWLFKTTPRTLSPSLYEVNSHLSNATVVDSCRYGICRAASVAKNRKSARYVASEPNTYMFAQLALMRALDRELLRLFGCRTPLWEPDRHRVFLRSPFMATIDLSDASDMVSRRLCAAVLPEDWRQLLFAARSSFVRFPDGSLLPLRTFAPMGNGFCFRVLTLMVATICAVSCDKQWSVYGDDIICHRRDYDHLRHQLASAGLVVNTAKSCSSQYIESCGLELYRGVDITPWHPHSLMTHGDRVIDLAAAVIAGDRGLPNVADSIMSNVVDLGFDLRYNASYQCREVRLPVKVARPTTHDVDDVPGLLRWFCASCEEHDVTDAIRLSFGWRWVNEFDPLAARFLTFASRTGSIPHSYKSVVNVPAQPRCVPVRNVTASLPE